jgi:hypothetical protein
MLETRMEAHSVDQLGKHSFVSYVWYLYWTVADDRLQWAKDRGVWPSHFCKISKRVMGGRLQQANSVSTCSFRMFNTSTEPLQMTHYNRPKTEVVGHRVSVKFWKE